MLPGSRELGAFCGASGRAVLIRHWPDYRRSIELVVPGQAPKQLHLGDQAVLGVACDNRGKRIWAVLGRWEQQRGNHELVLRKHPTHGAEPMDPQGGKPPPVERNNKPAAHDADANQPNNARAALIQADNLQIIKMIDEPISRSTMAERRLADESKKYVKCPPVQT